MSRKDKILTGIEIIAALAVVLFLFSKVEEPTPKRAEDPDDKTGRIYWADPDAPDVTAAITNTLTPTQLPTQAIIPTQIPTIPTHFPTSTPEPTTTPEPTPASSRTQPVERKNHNFKPYTRYTAYNLKSSQQYKLQQIAKTAENGIRVVTDPLGNARYCVALGTAWAGGQPKHIGRCLDVYMENGTVLRCVLADVKRQEDTVDGANLYGKTNNEVLEFIVDGAKIPKEVTRTGNVSNAGPEFRGGVAKIVVFDLWIEGFGG